MRIWFEIFLLVRRERIIKFHPTKKNNKFVHEPKWRSCYRYEVSHTTSVLQQLKMLRKCCGLTQCLLSCCLPLLCVWLATSQPIHIASNVYNIPKCTKNVRFVGCTRFVVCARALSRSPIYRTVCVCVHARLCKSVCRLKAAYCTANIDTEIETERHKRLFSCGNERNIEWNVWTRYLLWAKHSVYGNEFQRVRENRRRRRSRKKCRQIHNIGLMCARKFTTTWQRPHFSIRYFVRKITRNFFPTSQLQLQIIWGAFPRFEQIFINLKSFSG